MTLFPKTITYQTQPFTLVKGVATLGTPVVSTFQGSVQPMSGKEINSLPVGREDTGKVKIYSDTILPVSVKDGDDSGAIVIWQSQKWEVIFELKYQNNLINHYKYIGEYRGVE